MAFSNLQTLLQESSSTRAYFLSLPVSLQMQLHQQNDFIHTQFALRQYVAYYQKETGR